MRAQTTPICLPPHRSAGRLSAAGTGWLLLWLVLLAACAWPASGQVAVYDLSFQRLEEQSVNFACFDGGYLVLNLVTGKGTFLLIYRDLRDGVQELSFVCSSEAAQAFTAVSAAGRKTVIRAVAQSGTALAHYLAVGLIDQEIAVPVAGADVRVPVASRLTGHVVASDDESEIEFAPGQAALGFAGTALWQLSLNADATRLANRSGQTPAAALAELARKLDLLGFRDAKASGRP